MFLASYSNKQYTQYVGRSPAQFAQFHSSFCTILSDYTTVHSPPLLAFLKTSWESTGISHDRLTLSKTFITRSEGNLWEMELEKDQSTSPEKLLLG